MPAENQHDAGQGPVLLDIGGPIGALIVHTDASLRGAEIEIEPVEHRDNWIPGRHVAVHPRPTTKGFRYIAVFADLHEGDYQLHLRPDGPTHAPATIHGGRVTEINWPSG